MNKVHFLAERQDWETPRDLFDELNKEFDFSLDVCALPENAKCKEFYSPADDGLSQPWRGVCWMNPPYGKQIKDWMRKAYGEWVVNNVTVVCLIPSRTDAGWWHDYAMQGEVRYIRGRLKFQGAKHNAPFPSAVVIFRAYS